MVLITLTVFDLISPLPSEQDWTENAVKYGTCLTVSMGYHHSNVKGRPSAASVIALCFRKKLACKRKDDVIIT